MLLNALLTNSLRENIAGYYIISVIMLSSLVKYLRRPALWTEHCSLSPACIKEVMRRGYGLEVEVKSLNAFIEGQNYLLQAGEQKYVLKAIVETAGKDFEAAHSAVFDFLAEKSPRGPF